jgi:hypothetical protein
MMSSNLMGVSAYSFLGGGLGFGRLFVVLMATKHHDKLKRDKSKASPQNHEYT